MKKFILYLLLTIPAGNFLISSCSKSEDAQPSSTSSTSSTSGAAKQVLNVDGTDWPRTSSGHDTSAGYLQVYFASANGNCQVIFRSTNPPSGTYPTNWTSTLGLDQCKIMLAKYTTPEFMYWSPDNVNVTLVNSGGKYHVSFGASDFFEMVGSTPGTAKKRVSGDFGSN